MNKFHDDRQLAARMLSAKDRDRFTFINVGSLTQQKAHADILRAAFLLKQRVGNVFVVKIAGRGTLEKELISLRNELDLQDEVIFLGFQENIQQILCTSDCFIFSSHWEGFGLGVVEAMAAGLPVIRSDIPVLNEVAPSHLVMSYPVGDIEALAGNMQELLEHRLRFDEISKQALHWSQRFSAERIAVQLKAHYDGAIAVSMSKST